MLSVCLPEGSYPAMYPEAGRIGQEIELQREVLGVSGMLGVNCSEISDIIGTGGLEVKVPTEFVHLLF